jgi:hypothetical protein
MGDAEEAGQVQSRVDELLDLIDIDSDALREAEFAQAQDILDTMVGKRVKLAEMGETRITITTEDGSKYFFYGFLSGGE